MSAQETPDQETAQPVRNESRRVAILRRQRQLLHELEHLSEELMLYSIPVTQEEIDPIIQDLNDKKNRVYLEETVEGMENVLAVYDPNTMEFTEVDGNVDEVTRSVLKTMIERGNYHTTVDLKAYNKPLAVRLHIGDKHHNKAIGDGMLLISSMAEASNGAKWFLRVEDGNVIYSDQLAEADQNDLTAKLDRLIDESEFTLDDLEGYYLFVGDSEKLSEFIKVGPSTIAEIEEVTAQEPPEEVDDSVPEEEASILEASETPSNEYLAKVGPQGRIRHHYSTQELKTMAEKRGFTVREVMMEINNMAIDRSEDTNFIYVHFKD